MSHNLEKLTIENLLEDLLEDFNVDWIRQVYIPSFSDGKYHQIETDWHNKFGRGATDPHYRHHPGTQEAKIAQVELHEIQENLKPEYKKYRSFYNKIIKTCDSIANNANRSVDDITIFVGYDKHSGGLKTHVDGVDVLAFNLYGNTTWVYPDINEKVYLEQRKDAVITPGTLSHHVIPPDDGIRLSVGIILEDK